MMQAVRGDVAQQAKRWLGALILAWPPAARPMYRRPQAPSQPAPTLPQYETVPVAPVETSTKIGLLLPLSGQQAGLGRTLLQAAEMGLFEVGDDSFTLLVEDTATPAGADSAARKLLAGRAPRSCSARYSRPTPARSRRSRRARMCRCWPSPTTGPAAQPGVYIMGVTPQDEVERVVQYAASQGMRASRSSPRPRPTATSSTSRSATRCRTRTRILAEMALYDPNSPDYTQVVEQLSTAYQNNPFDALMLPEGGAKLRQLAPLLPAFQLGPQTVQILGTGLWANDPALAQETGLGRRLVRRHRARQVAALRRPLSRHLRRGARPARGPGL